MRLEVESKTYKNMAKARKQRKRRGSRTPAARRDWQRGGAPDTGGAGGITARAFWPGAVLLGMVLAAFWPVFFAGFVWDDKAFLEAPPVSQALGIFDIWFNPASLPFEAHYWPMLYSSFWLENRLWGFNPLGFHAVNVLLHGVNTLLLWRLLERMGVPGAWLIAALFAVHPLRVEPVAWVMSRKDLLGTLFYLLAVGYWLRYRQRPQSGTYLALLGLFAAGMFSKTVVVTLPAALLVWAWWQQGHIRPKDLRETAPLFLLGFAIAAGDLSFYGGRAEINFDFSFAERLIIAAKALWFYTGQLLWPHPLPVIYPKWDINPANLLNWLYLLAACAFAAALYLARHRIGRGPLAGALFFAITLSPALGFGNNSYLEYSFVADRYQYLAGTGLLAVLVAAAVMACGTFPALRRGGMALAALLLTTWGTLAWQHAWNFKDEIALFSHIVSLNPAAHSAHYNLGIALVEEERLEEAEVAYKTELERDTSDPKYLQAINHLASLHFNGGRYEKAQELYSYSAAVNPEDAETHQNLGSTLAQRGHYREALKSFERALALDPQLEIARTNMQLARKKLNEGGRN